MKPSDEMMSKLYHQLGRVFFLVAYADKSVHANEASALKKSINDYWLDYDNTFDEFEGDTAFHIEFTFDYLIDNPKSENAILTDFKEFIAEHKSLFTVDMKELIIKTSEMIADAFAGTSKEEEKVIKKIKAILA